MKIEGSCQSTNLRIILSNNRFDIVGHTLENFDGENHGIRLLSCFVARISSKFVDFVNGTVIFRSIKEKD